MKKIIFLLLVMVLACQAQYVWRDSLGVKTTAWDSTFAKPWQECRLFPTVDAYIKFAYPDSTDFSSHKWTLIKANTAFAFPPPLQLKRLKLVAVSDTGSVYIIGKKSTSQF